MGSKPHSFPLDRMHLDRSESVSLYRQLYSQLRKAILNGTIAAHSRLPPTREAAQILSVGRNTVVLAYDMLAAEGLLRASVGSGVWVEPRLEEPLEKETPIADTPTFSRRGMEFTSQYMDRSIPGQLAFHPGYPNMSEFPFSVWSRLVRQHARYPREDLFGYHMTSGHPKLRRAISEFFAASRGIRCDENQVVVTSGTQATLDLLARLLLDPGDTFWIEDPGYEGAFCALKNSGGVPEFISVSNGRWLFPTHGPAPRAIFLTPSCQWPLGIEMGLDDRRQVLELASVHDAWILEDDYDGEYQFASRSLPALQSLASENRVIYMGTFSKTMFPALRIAFLIAPFSVVPKLESALNISGQYPPLLLQAALADFILEGHFARHLKRMRSLYDRRKSQMVEAISCHLSSWFTLHMPQNGMQLLCDLNEELVDRKVALACQNAGISVSTISNLFRGDSSTGNGLLMGYAALNQKEIDHSVQVVKSVMTSLEFG